MLRQRISNRLLTVSLSVFAISLFANLLAAAEPSAAELLEQAQLAAAQDKMDEAIRLAGEAIQADPKLKQGYYLRGMLQSHQGEYTAAVKDLSHVVELDPQNRSIYNIRGSEYFKAGQIEKSIADFDKSITLNPGEEPSHWKRGISFYYSGRYADGRKQFEAYQTFDDNDVENAVWRFLCMARAEGLDKAQADMLRIKRDPRVPMMEVYDMYKGELKPEDVLSAAKAGDPSPAALNQQLFYAHLYLGLYYDALKQDRRALEHVEKSVEHKIGHYMWDVARVHRDLLKKRLQESQPQEQK